MISLYTFVVALGPYGEMPKELLEAQKNRDALFSTARIEWSWSKGKTAHHYSSTYANGDFLLVDRGDETGLVDPGMAQPNMAHAYSPRRLLWTAEQEQWDYRDQNVSGMYFGPGCPIVQDQPDIRTLGWLPLPVRADQPHMFFPGSFFQSTMDAARFDWDVRQKDAGITEIRGASDNAEFSCELDLLHGFAPLHVQWSVHQPDGTIRAYESRFRYADMDGTWFPVQIELIDEHLKTHDTLKVEYAEFDKPWHEKSLEPSTSLGMPAGVNLGFRFADGKVPDETTGLYIFDGQRPVPSEEASRRQREGSFPSRSDFFALVRLRRERPLPGSTPPDFVAFLDSNTGGASRSPGLWEEYVRRFLIVHQCDENQTRRAWKQLAKCQEEALEYLGKHQKEIDECDKAIQAEQAVQASSKAPGDEDAKLVSRPPTDSRLAGLQRQRTRLVEEPLEKIFNMCLRNSLWEMLTDEQQNRWSRKKQEHGQQAGARAQP